MDCNSRWWNGIWVDGGMESGLSVVILHTVLRFLLTLRWYGL